MPSFPIIDCQVHLENEITVDNGASLAKSRKVKSGIVER